MDKFKKLLGLGVMGVTGLGAVKAESINTNNTSLKPEGDKQTIIMDQNNTMDEDTSRVLMGGGPDPDIEKNKNLEKLKIEYEKMKNSLENAQQNLNALRGKFNSEMDILLERYPNKAKTIKILKDLPSRIHAFAASKLKDNSLKFKDPAFVNTGKSKLGDAVVDGGNPMTGDLIVSMGSILNEEVSHISGQTNISDDMTKRSELGGLPRFIAAAEFDVAHSQFLLNELATEIAKAGNIGSSPEFASSK